MRRAAALLGLIFVAACSWLPSPATPSVTQTIGGVVVTHPADWHLVTGPTAPGGRAVPVLYLADAPLTVVPCPSIGADGSYTGCAQPIAALPDGGVLVTVSPNLGLMEAVPPRVTTITLTESCHSIGGERSILAVAAGMVVEACLRGPGIDQSEAQVRALVASMKFA